jgi:hypothetical protein
MCGKFSCSFFGGGGSGIRTHVGVTQTCFQEIFAIPPFSHVNTRRLTSQVERIMCVLRVAIVI